MQLLCDQEHTYGAVLRRAAGTGSGSPEAEGTRLLLVAPWYFTEWYTTHGTEFRRWGASVCAHVLACGVWACVRARDSVCYNIHFSLSPILQLLIFRQDRLWTLRFWKTRERSGGIKKKQSGLLWLLTVFMDILPSLLKNKSKRTKYSIVHFPAFSTTPPSQKQNIGMKNLKQKIPREDLNLNEHAKHLKLACSLQQKQHSHINTPECI